MKKSAISKAKLIREYTTINLVASDIIGFLRAAGHVPAGAKDIKVTFQVPSGGDYSGRKLDIEDDELTVTWTVETEDKTGF